MGDNNNIYHPTGHFLPSRAKHAFIKMLDSQRIRVHAKIHFKPTDCSVSEGMGKAMIQWNHFFKYI